jgi:hypothetical protein
VMMVVLWIAGGLAAGLIWALLPLRGMRRY